MDWLTDNRLWIVFGVDFLWMHLRMHGGHGGCGAHGGDGGGPNHRAEPHSRLRDRRS